MQIVAQCPACGSCFLLDGGAADRRITCENCFQLFKVPPLEEVPKAARIIKTAAGSVYVEDNGKTYG